MSLFSNLPGVNQGPVQDGEPPLLTPEPAHMPFSMDPVVPYSFTVLAPVSTDVWKSLEW